MATTAPPPHNASSSSSVSRLLSRLRSRSTRKSQSPHVQDLPVDTRPPLKPSPLPLVLPDHQHTLSQLGWTTVTFPTSASTSSSNPPPNSPNPPNSTPNSYHAPPPTSHPLQLASTSLFAAAQSFFALPSSEKSRWAHKLGSEEGWSCIPGEKEFITLRTLDYTPDILKEPAKRYWDLVGAYLDSCLDRIGGSLDLPLDSEENGSRTEAGLRRYVGPCKTMGQGEEQKTATMLRLFRYESWAPKIVAEPHADLGLLSLVVGDVPGLEVWNGVQFWDIEREYQRWGQEREKEKRRGEGGEDGVGEVPCATLLGGRQLERLTNFRYKAGGHRVVSYGKPGTSASHSPSLVSPPPQPQPKNSSQAQDSISPETKPSSSSDPDPGPSEKQYRYSIVFVLRAHEPVVVNTDTLTTSITGPFQDPVRGVEAGVWYEQIRGKHFNINIGFEEREKQRRKIAERKMQGQTQGNGQGQEQRQEKSEEENGLRQGLGQGKGMGSG